MKTDIIEVLTKLVSFQTVSATSDQEKNAFHAQQFVEAHEYIKHLFQDTPLIVETIETAGKKTLTVSNKKTIAPDIAMIVHLDVVPAGESLWTMRQEGDRLFGRGVSDMKGSITACLIVMRELVKMKSNDLPSVMLIITPDEEIGGASMKFLRDKLKYSPQFVLCPDGGYGWKMVTNAKGCLQFHFQTTGKSAHASRLAEGVNAAEPLIELYQQLRRVFPHQNEAAWETTTFNLGAFHTGQAANQVPDLAEMKLDFRFTNQSERALIEKELQSAINASPLEIKTLSVVDGHFFESNPNHQITKKFLYCVEKVIGKQIEFVKEYGASDARFFTDVPTVVLIGDGKYHHSSKEEMSLTSLEQYAEAVLTFIKSYRQ